MNRRDLPPDIAQRFQGNRFWGNRLLNMGFHSGERILRDLFHYCAIIAQGTFYKRCEIFFRLGFAMNQKNLAGFCLKTGEPIQ
ncbi:hypothetical protein SDC9_165501 [bioreactor metagenome]|uniref:Uncharacterized protein n=1 Tax=bioreactor metagenome TaxID=1076179 RepID=A0A645G1R7_9ZZZZ